MRHGHRFSIRKARRDDADGILNCLDAAFSPYREVYTPAAYRDTVLDPDTLRERLSAMTLLVATDDRDGAIIGTIGCLLIGDREGHLRGMAVAPGWQGGGVAERLLRTVEDDLRARGRSRVTLDTTRVLTRAIRFYEKNGYRRVGAGGDFFGMELLGYVKELTVGPESGPDRGASRG